MQKDFGDKGLVVVGVTKANEVDVRKFQLELGATYPILAEGDINFDRFMVSGIPQSFLVAPDGMVVAQNMKEVDAELAKRFAN